ncbi:MAG: thiamine phosphate synthase [Lachnospiraceae bacterium]|nr:MAG: thiamine phosphate synthase [Lachnospiraceae bacterium]
MRLDKKYMQLYVVTDRAWTGNKTLYEQIKEALENGVTCVQLREKNLDEASFIEEAKKISVLCRQYNTPFIVNDNVNVAIASNADGIHIGQEDMGLKDVRKIVGENMIIGISAHTVEEAKFAQENGADYIGIGAVFETSTKNDVDIIPYEKVKSICEAVDIPKVAIGGINAENILKLKGSGIDGVAVVSAIFGAKDIGKATKELYTLSNNLI